MARGQQILPHSGIPAHNFMSISEAVQLAIPTPAVCSNHASLLRRFLYGSLQACSRGIRNMAKSYPSDARVFHFCRYHYQRLSCSTAPPLARLFSTNVALIHFNYSSKTISSRCNHGMSEFMEPCPSSPITAQSEDSFKPQCTGTILLAGHPPDRSKPKFQRLVCAVENCSRYDRDLIITASTLKHYGANGLRLFMATPRTTKSIWPTQLVKIIAAGFFRRKPVLEFRKCFGVILHGSLILHVVGT